MSTRTSTRDVRRLLMAASPGTPLARQASSTRARITTDSTYAPLLGARPPRTHRHPPWRWR